MIPLISSAVLSRPGDEIRAARNPTLDAIRGFLSLDVLAGHVYGPGAPWPLNTGWFAVWCFFALSSYVLVQSWDGRYFRFLLARFIRLWPIYAVCITVGYCLTGQAVEPARYLFYPVSIIAPRVDGPTWSLGVEACAMLFMPVLFWVSRGSSARALIAILVCLAATETINGMCVLGDYFILGAWASRWSFRLRAIENPLGIWLGRISYPLYVSHAIVLGDLGGPLWLRLILVFGVAQVLTITLERWSILASRWCRQSPGLVPSRDLCPHPFDGPFREN